MRNLIETLDAGLGERQPLLHPGYGDGDGEEEEEEGYAANVTAAFTSELHDDGPDSHQTDLSYPQLKFWIAWLGVFLASADSGLVLATYSEIASDLQELQNGAWLITGYTLGYGVALPVYGAACDVFGRKPPLLMCYALFGVGAVISGAGPTLSTVIVGRVIQGIGGAGTTAVVSIIITDVAPISRVAVLRSYINLAAILGRGIGGPIGGLLVDTIGWRWSFIMEAPFIALCLIAAETQALSQPGTISKLGHAFKWKHRLDIPGLLTFAAAMTSFLLLVDSLTKGISVKAPITLTPLIVFPFSIILLILIETRWSSHPLLAPSLFKNKGVSLQYLVQILLLAAQFAVLSNIPNYFIRTLNVSSTLASLTILPAPLGNALGSYIAGLWIQRSKTFLPPLYLTCILSPLAFAIMLVRWSPLPVPQDEHGKGGGLTAHIPISLWECLVLLPAAFSLGLTSSAGFVGISTSVDDGLTAMGISVFYLSQQVGTIVGAAGGTGVARMAFEKILRGRLVNQECVKMALCDARWAWKYFTPERQRVVSESYAQGYFFVSTFSLVCACLAIPLVLLMPKRRVE